MKFEYDILVSLENGDVLLKGADFHLKEIHENYMEGEALGMKVILCEDENARVSLTLKNPTNMVCDRLGWSLTYRDPKRDLSQCRVHCFGKSVDTSGMPRLCDVKKTQPDSAISGLFRGSKEPCLFLGTELPQSNLHLYEAELLDSSTVVFTATTKVPVGMRKRACLSTEKTYVYDGMKPLEAMQKYAAYIPDLPKEKLPAPLVGWNSWDYYFSTVSAEAVQENMDFIVKDEKLRGAMENCIGMMQIC